MKETETQKTETQNNTLENLYTVRQFCERFKFVSQSSIRYLIFNADTNKFNKVITRIGRKILLDAAAFEAWLKETNQENIVQFN